jgi:hypothetical protein
MMFEFLLTPLFAEIYGNWLYRLSGAFWLEVFPLSTGDRFCQAEGEGGSKPFKRNL